MQFTSFPRLFPRPPCFERQLAFWRLPDINQVLAAMIQIPNNAFISLSSQTQVEIGPSVFIPDLLCSCHSYAFHIRLRIAPLTRNGAPLLGENKHNRHHRRTARPSGHN